MNPRLTLASRRLIGGILLGLGMAAPASAAILNYGFSFTASDGANAGSLFSGSYSFDDALAPTGTLGSVSNYALDSFNFVYNGETFTAADDPLAYVSFDPAFSNLLGLSYIATLGTTDVTFLEGFTGVSEQDFYSAVTNDSAGPFAANGPITTTGGPATVPEPGAWLASLLLVGFGLVGLRRRVLMRDDRVRVAA